jgi:glycosidase
LAKIRKENLALTYGNFETLQVTDKTYVYARQYFDHNAIVLFNKSSEPLKITVDLPDYLNHSGMTAEFGQKFSLKENTLETELAPWSFEILSRP